jgi:hypothetical protein
VDRLRNRLLAYYASHPDDPVHISIPKGTFRPEITFKHVEEPKIGSSRSVVPSDPRSESGSSPSADQKLRQRILEDEIHAYHLTQNDEGNPMWSYKTLKFQAATPTGPLVATGVNLPKLRANRNRHKYDYEAVLDRGHLIVTTRRADGTPDMSVQLFPRVGGHNFPWSGGDIITTTWHDDPLISISIWNDVKLPCAAEVEDGDPISDPRIMKDLERVWRKGAERIRLSRLPAVGDEAGDLASALNTRFKYLNDAEFGHELVRYFIAETTHALYCRDLRTTFRVHHVKPSRFTRLDGRSPLRDTCFDLTIRESVVKPCPANIIQVAVFMNAQLLAHHFVHPEYDFAWCIDLPSDATFAGKVSDIFQIDFVEVDGHTIVSGSTDLGDKKISVLQDDSEFLVCTVDISGIHSDNALRKIRYGFHTLKAKAFRHVSYGTRVLTRGMATKIEFNEETGIDDVIMTPYVVGEDRPKPSEFKTRELSVSGWLLPRSGVTFSFRYNEPKREGHRSAHSSSDGVTIRQQWDEHAVVEMLQKSSLAADIRIFVSFFVTDVDLFSVLLQVLTNSQRRVTIMMLDPDGSVLAMRYGTEEKPIRETLTAASARAKIISQLNDLNELAKALQRRVDQAQRDHRQQDTGSLEVRVYECAPTLVSYYTQDSTHSQDGMLVGMLLLHESANLGPMIQVKRGEPMWDLIEKNWETVLRVSKPRISSPRRS